MFLIERCGQIKRSWTAMAWTWQVKNAYDNADELNKGLASVEFMNKYEQLKKITKELGMDKYLELPNINRNKTRNKLSFQQ